MVSFESDYIAGVHPEVIGKQAYGDIEQADRFQLLGKV